MEEENKRKNVRTKKTAEPNNSYDSIYRPVTEFTAGSSKQSSGGAGKTVVTSFFVGAIGAAIVLGTCLGVPSIRETLFNMKSNTSTISQSSSSTTNQKNDTISLTDYSDTSVGVAAKVLPSVVGIKVEFPVSSIFSSMSTTASGSGSGIIISEDGYILTNNHIISSGSSSSYFYEVGEASKVTVYLYNDETPYEASIIGTDAQTDIAVIKIDKTGLTAAEIGDSDSTKVGEFSMAIGNPLGMQSSVSTGIVSAVNREITTDGVTYKLMQTDAAINAGNSGGALVNSKGQIIGINTMKISSTGVEGMGFAIPINSAKPIYEQLIEYKKVKRPYIGIGGKDLSEEIAKANNLPVGIYVKTVEDFSPAEKAGIKVGDVIVAIDGTSVKTMNELNAIKSTHAIGDTVTLKVSRDGQEKDIEVKLQEQQ